MADSQRTKSLSHRSQPSEASSAPDQRHLGLIAAAAQGNEVRVRELLAGETPWVTSSGQGALRVALQKAAARGRLSLVNLLLDHGADPNPNPQREGEAPAVVKAAEGGHVEVVTELLAHKADANWRYKNGQTALFTAAAKGHEATVRALLGGGVSVTVRDREDRTPLLFLVSGATEKGGNKWTPEMLRMMVESGADLEARDRIGRTPLLWAATNGNVKLVDLLLSGTLCGRRADISAANHRNRTALHLAAENNLQDMMRVLLERGADVRAVSDGGWTALHNSAQSGHTAVAKQLLAAGADVNAQLRNGMTPLHWAAFNGHEDVVQLLLTCTEANLATRDAFDRTPMLCAAEKMHRNIVQLLSPARNAHRLSPEAQRACRAFDATIVDFGSFRDGKKQLVFKHSVWDTLYGWDEENDKPKVATTKKNIKHFRDNAAFRWIHLPANNLAWAETLLSKWFIESDLQDIEGFKALEKCFDQEHRGAFVHANFMRTFAQRISTHVDGDDRNGSETPRAEAMSDFGMRPPLSRRTTEINLNDSSNSSNNNNNSSNSNNNNSNTNGNNGNNTKEGKKKTKAERSAEKDARKMKGPLANVEFRPRPLSRVSTSSMWDIMKLPPTNDKMVLFMPFLHYETDERRVEMQRAIKMVDAHQPMPSNVPRDYTLIEGYLHHTPPLHPRRTLDQFFYHGIDTTMRDTDQVIQKYCRKHDVTPKVFVVDQLWLWVLARDLIITCFPQRWNQPKGDPLNVLDGVIEETNAKTRAPVQSVYDLTTLVTSRCAGMFDRHRLDDQNYQFLDMFESSIGDVTNEESVLFRDFNRASAMSAEWLSIGQNMDEKKVKSQRKAIHHDPMILDTLLAIGREASLLGEIKDIRDELNILTVVLDSQAAILHEFEDSLIDGLRAEVSAGIGGNISRKASDALVAEMRRRSRDQKRLLDVHRRDIDRMDRQAESIYISLTHLLDLKQKHSNALEARFARDQAVSAAREGQTIMVFTIVTTIFLPMSFVASFFSLDLDEWSDGRLTIAYVSKYMFGIGLCISVPLVFMAFTVSDMVKISKKLYVFGKHHLPEGRRRLTAPFRRNRPTTSTTLMPYASSRGDPRMADASWEGGIYPATADDARWKNELCTVTTACQRENSNTPSWGNWKAAGGLGVEGFSLSRMRSTGNPDPNRDDDGLSGGTAREDHSVTKVSINSGAASWHAPTYDLDRARTKEEDLEKGKMVKKPMDKMA